MITTPSTTPDPDTAVLKKIYTLLMCVAIAVLAVIGYVAYDHSMGATADANSRCRATAYAESITGERLSTPAERLACR